MKKILLATVLVLSAAGVSGMEILGGRIGLLGANFVAPTINDKSNVYGPLTGEIIYDSSDATFYGRTQSSTWTSLGGSSSVIPTAAILTFAGSSCPTGYLPTDGAAVSRTTYASLFGIIGTTYGYGDNSTTFNMPDYRGRFLRGVDAAAGRDPDAASRSVMNTGGNSGDNVGSIQADAFSSHTHIQNAHSHVQQGSYTGGGTNGLQSVGIGSTQNATSTSSATATNQNTGGNETRPVNAYVNYCIKY